MSASHIRRMPLPVSTSLLEPRPRPSVLSDEHTVCRREIQRLLIENAQLASDLSDLRARYDDLKRSAEIWAELYERQLGRRGQSS
ncbi:MAG TPA: hypothetical protein VN085_07210 [Vicinamibacterales bacterium]|jgi:hypothetical protein|nr:hypothetical protein [Vicinamibacterales bacterium]